ncbi:helix-turn-helix domain-containing protein [Microbacterium sp.]|uniref:helix-turn-helix domain-containing protein n=1 Tax=Microbacterium sp. TaxID=51671 RepID=UPI002625AC98|nr:helix-turn-helix domain-containing protein [Microbacterium sp.]
MAKRLDAAGRAARREEIARRTAAGQSQREIAEALGVSRPLVQKEQRALREQGGALTRHERNAVPVRDASTHTRATIVKGGASSHGISAAMQTILPPPDHYSTWRRIDLDRDTWAKADANELISLLINVSPDMSRAVWDYLRLLNSGHEIIAVKPGTEDEPDERGQVYVDSFRARLEEQHGSLKVISGRLFMNALTRGAFFAELVLDERGREPVDIATPDPAIVRFKRVDDPDRGAIWMPGQWQDGQFVIFDSPTVSYMPVDPEADSPYGRAILSPAIFPTVFLLGLLHDLRRVIAQQGYPRTNIRVNLERLRETYKALDMKDFERKIAQLMDAIATQYAQLEPDDAFVVTDTVEVDRAEGAVDTSVMEGAAAVIEATERMAMRALKSMPLLMGIGEGQSEAKANREWELIGEYVGHMQHYAETLLSRLFTLALRAQGVPSDVKMRFAGVRSASELRDEQTMQLKLDNASRAEALGYMGRDEASLYAVGHEAMAEPHEIMPTQEGGDASEIEAEPGANRHVRAASDDVWSNPDDDHVIIDDVRMRDATETWREVFEGEDVEELLLADVEDEQEDSDE